MSKQHQASRRRNYGRRQHQVHERAERRPSAVEMPSVTLSYEHREGRTGSPLAVEASGGWSSPQGT